MLTPFGTLKSGQRILLAFSGGIDSSAAAVLAQQAGLDVHAVYMDLFPGKDLSRVREVADRLKIPLTVLNLQEEFRNTVMKYCWETYRGGKTPNPCAMCNPVFKFGYLMKYAQQNGFDALVTGHYASLRLQPSGHNALFRGADRKKDQSYFLFGLTQEQLDFSCFPLGDMTKDQVRAIVTELNLPNASDPESQDICFATPDQSVGELLRQTFNGEMRSGNFVDENGKVLGKHNGIHTFTPGQRKGTGVALGKPAYVRAISAERNEVELVTDSAMLMSDFLRFNSLVVHDELPSEFRALIQIRYRSMPVEGTVRLLDDGTGEIRFDSPVRSITPGQAVVLYREDRQIAGGWID